MIHTTLPCNKSKTQVAKRICIYTIALLLISTSFFIGLRCFYREQVSDDLLYHFVLDDNPLGENVYKDKVQNFSDILRSQSIQYLYSNGRFIVHIFVQLFAGLWGKSAFSIFSALLSLISMILMGILCLPKDKRTNPLWWLGITIAFLYFFQVNDRIWYEIALGMNYLYPIPLILTYLILFRKWEIYDPHTFHLSVAALLGFVAGWLQECFSLPLSGGVFFTLVYKLYKRLHISRARWILAIFLWIGTLILVLAPGNFIRLSAKSSIYNSFINGIMLLKGTRLFWLMIVGLFYLYIFRRRRFYEFIKQNSIIFYTLTCAICFGMIANTQPWSFNGISFYSAVILFSLISVFPPILKNIKLILSISIIGLALIYVHQIRIINGCKKAEAIHHEFIQNYIESTDGIMEKPTIDLSEDVKPFVNTWFDQSIAWWYYFTIKQYYFNGEKPLIVMDKTDFNAFRGYNMVSLKKISNGIYLGDSYLWFEPYTQLAEGDSIVIKFSRESIESASYFYSKFNKMPSEKTVVIGSSNTIQAPDGLIGLNIYNQGEIKDVVIHKSGQSHQNHGR